MPSGNAIPTPGNIYKIFHDNEDAAVSAVSNVDVKLVKWDDTKTQHWVCTKENDYGLGFMNFMTRNFLSFNDYGDMRQTPQEKEGESFSFTPLPQGGYQMGVAWKSSDYCVVRKQDCLHAEKQFNADDPIYLAEIGTLHW